MWRSSFVRRAVTAIAWAAWAGTVAVVGWLAFAYLLPEDLSSDRLGYGRLAAVAFFGRVFTFHAGWALLTAAAFAAVARRWRLLAAAGIAAVATLGPTGYACRPRHPPAAAGPAVRVMSVNLYFANGRPTTVVDAIRTANPDVCLLQEYTAELDGILAPPLSAAYPYHCVQPRILGFGLAVYSRLPFDGDPEPDVARDRHGGRVQVRFAVRIGGRRVVVYAVHPAPPLDTGRILQNRRQTVDYVAQVRAERDPVVLVGDWNFTAETANAAALRSAGLTDAFDLANPGGRGATWPLNSGWRSWPPGVRLDAAYLSAGLTCTRYQTVTADDGSDHHPIVTDVAIAAGP